MKTSMTPPLALLINRGLGFHRENKVLSAHTPFLSLTNSSIHPEECMKEGTERISFEVSMLTIIIIS